MVLGQDVSHSICFTSDVRDFVMVAMVAVVQARKMAQVSSSLVQGDGLFAISTDCCNIVV